MLASPTAATLSSERRGKDERGIMSKVTEEVKGRGTIASVRRDRAEEDMKGRKDEREWECFGRDGKRRFITERADKEDERENRAETALRI